MLTLKQCRKLVDPKKEKYSDEELEVMLSFNKELARIIIEEVNEKAGSTYEQGI